MICVNNHNYFYVDDLWFGQYAAFFVMHALGYMIKADHVEQITTKSLWHGIILINIFHVYK